MNQPAIDIIKKFERCVLTAYWDDKGKVWTIGWGETGPDVKQGVVWTQQIADERLLRRVNPLEARVRALIRTPLNDAAVGALISLAYNAGIGILEGSRAIAAINARAWITAAHELLDDDHIRGVEDDALLKRRCYEVFMFLDNRPSL